MADEYKKQGYDDPLGGEGNDAPDLDAEQGQGQGQPQTPMDDGYDAPPADTSGKKSAMRDGDRDQSDASASASASPAAESGTGTGTGTGAGTGTGTGASSKRIAYLALIACGVAVMCFVIAYILYRILDRRTKSKVGYLLPESKIPLMGTELTKLDGSLIPGSGNGQRRTIMFWVYIHDIDKFKGSTIRNIFYRGDRNHDNSIDPQLSSPSIWLDSMTNKMHVRFSKISGEPSNFRKYEYKDEQTAGTLYYKVKDLRDQRTKYDMARHGITVDYIPIQRWVHVAIVVNEAVNGGIINAYLDGELVKSDVSNTTSDNFVVREYGATSGTTPTDAHYTSETSYLSSKRDTSVTVTKDFSNLNLDRAGDIYVGGSPSESTIGPGFSGLVSGIQFFNYDLNVSDIYKVYVKGPIDNLAAKLGLPAYGVRSPVYRVG